MSFWQAKEIEGRTITGCERKGKTCVNTALVAEPDIPMQLLDDVVG